MTTRKTVQTGLMPGRSQARVIQDLAPTGTSPRTGFLIHGDSIEHPGTASHGCIIMPRAIREAIAQNDDHDLNVVAGEAVTV
jgi:hypothetical protein